MPLEEVNAGKKSQWMELEITGNVLHRYIWQAYVHHNLIITFPFRYYTKPQSQLVEAAASDVSLPERQPPD
jgi:hypothetical protein